MDPLIDQFKHRCLATFRRKDIDVYDLEFELTPQDAAGCIDLFLRQNCTLQMIQVIGNTTSCTLGYRQPKHDRITGKARLADKRQGQGSRCDTCCDTLNYFSSLFINCHCVLRLLWKI